MRIVLNVLVSFACLVMTTLSATLQAQPPASSDPLALITPDAIAMLTVQPSLVAKKQVHAAFATEVISAAGLEYFGFDPLQLERIDVNSGLPVPGPGECRW